MDISRRAFRILVLSGILFSFSLMPSRSMAADESPCAGSLQYLIAQYDSDEATRKAFQMVFEGLQNLPKGYSYNGSSMNPWKRAGSGKEMHRMMTSMFETWCTALPEIQGTADNALDPILYFAWIYYQNPAGQDFVQGRDPADPLKSLETGSRFLAMWGDEYRSYMDSEASVKRIGQWVDDPRIEINDYVKTNAESYRSWNEFFARNLKTDANGNYPDRPVTLPDRDYVIVAPTDCIMNPLVQVLGQEDACNRGYIENPLQLDTVLDVKNIPISVNDLLGTAPDKIKEKFIGGNGLACVLMPNTYHHFHSPVDGTVIHAEIVETGAPGTPGTFGYPDFPNWVPMDGNVGRPGTDFSQFQAFQRGVIIIRVEYENLPNQSPEKMVGYVASIPVGLNSVGSVVLNTCDSKQTDHVNCFRIGGRVRKGITKLGNFFFGGSLNIMLFSKGMLSPAVQTRMGNQIGVIDLGASPKSFWSQD